MLVLTRSLGEGIVLGNGVEIRVSRISRGEVKLAFSGPREIRIAREEHSTPREKPVPTLARVVVDRQTVWRLPCAGSVG
jgi:carbon storage regulator CsrA